MCSLVTWFNLQIMNFCWWRNRESYIDRANMQMWVFLKARWFYSFTINSHPKLKNSAHYFWDIYQEKLTTKFNKVVWWALWVEGPRNFYNSFFVKNYEFWIFFQVMQSILLKNEKKNLLKKDTNHIKIVWHSKR